MWYRTTFASKVPTKAAQTVFQPIATQGTSKYTQWCQSDCVSQPQRPRAHTRATQTIPISTSQRCALFWDADNVSPKAMNKILDTLNHFNMLKYVDVKRAYGDLSNKNKPQWKHIWAANNFHVTPVTPVTAQKNNADFEMALDILELVLTRRFATVIVVSSDVDFCPVARRVRHHGVTYWGFGYKWTAKEYQTACSHFFNLTDALPNSNPLE